MREREGGERRGKGSYIIIMYDNIVIIEREQVGPPLFF